MKTNSKIVLLAAGATILALSACGQKQEAKKEQKFSTSCEITWKDQKLTVKGDCSAKELAKVPKGQAYYHYKSQVNEGTRSRGK